MSVGIVWPALGFLLLIAVLVVLIWWVTRHDDDEEPPGPPPSSLADAYIEALELDPDEQGSGPE